MCEHGDTVDLMVPIPADLAHEGTLLWKLKPVDRCISDLVIALNAGGIYTRGCCCGHGRRAGSILLHDGRVLKVAR